MDCGCERFGKPRKKRREKLEELERENTEQEIAWIKSVFHLMNQNVQEVFII